MRDPAPDETKRKRLRFSIWYVLLGLWAVLWLQHTIHGYLQAERIAYSDFKHLVAEGKVAEVSVSSTTIGGVLKPEAEGGGASGKKFNVVRVDDPDLLKNLERAGVRVSGEVESRFFSTLLSWILPIGLFVAFWIFSLRRLGQGAQGYLALGRSRAKVYVEKGIAVRFSDVAGVDEAKAELEEVVDFLKQPDRFRRLGAHIPKGVLLVGPPGTGKTLLARAVAGEAAVPFFSISGSEFVEMFVGLGAARVRDLFEQARQKAPCIIFIDELDAIAKVRGVGPVGSDEREQTLNQLLVEMDGFDPRTGIILMAATNRPEILDPALLRAGRFDRHVLVDRPDKVGRLAILKLHARKIVLESEADLDAIAGMTAGFVGADLANIVNEAALLAVRRNRDKVGRLDLEEAFERVVAGLEKRSRVLTPAEKQRVAHHETGHALVALAIPGAEPIRKISIIPRGVSALGYTLRAPVEDRFLLTREELENKIAVLLGGRAAEELVFGDLSTGSQDDIAKATDIARSMVRSYGMSRRLGPRAFEADRRPFLVPGVHEEAQGDYSEQTAQTIDAEVADIVEAQQQRAHHLLEERRGILLSAAARLLVQESLSGEELQALAGTEPAPVALAAPAAEPPVAPNVAVKEWD